MATEEIMDPQKIEEFRGYSDGTDEFILELFDQYFESTDSLIEKIKASKQAQDDKQLLSEIHALKGSTRNMGLIPFSNFIIDWEKRVKDTGSGDFEKDFEILKNLYQDVKDFRNKTFPA